ncbi:MAG: DUF1059 domain-containing protein [Dehalococcoidia bacterium]
MAKVINCPCGWNARSDSDDDLVKQVQEHAKGSHDQNPSREEVLSMAKPE